MSYRLTTSAIGQVDAILLDSARNHGQAAAGRYGYLILTVMAALGDEPLMIGSVEVPSLPGIHAYPLRLARRRIESAQRVGNPRHLIVYRLRSERVVEVLGLVHDRMVLSRAVRKIVRTTD